MGNKRIEIHGVGAVEEGSAEAHALGALLGMAVGDALGTTYEFARIDQPDYPTLAIGPATDIVGGGPFQLAAGQITDDTQMAICLARSLVERHADAPAGSAFDRLDALDIATRYLAWFKHAFDVGNQTASALRAIGAGTPVGAAGREVWHRSGRVAAGNGSLMRSAPIGVLLARTSIRDERLDLLVEAALIDSLITHADPRCAIACAAFDAAIACGVMASSHTPAAQPATMQLAAAQLAAARAAIPIAVARLRELWHDDREDLIAIDRAEFHLLDDLQTAASPTPDVYRGDLDLRRTAGFVRVAFRLAFWHLMHTPIWRDALVDVASRGGDADTNAAIAGALLGSRDGVTAIPTVWIDRVLAATQPGPADWADAHHPRHLLPLVALAR